MIDPLEGALYYPAKEDLRHGSSDRCASTVYYDGILYRCVGGTKHAPGHGVPSGLSDYPIPSGLVGIPQHIYWHETKDPDIMRVGKWADDGNTEVPLGNHPRWGVTQRTQVRRGRKKSDAALRLFGGS